VTPVAELVLQTVLIFCPQATAPTALLQRGVVAPASAGSRPGEKQRSAYERPACTRCEADRCSLHSATSARQLLPQVGLAARLLDSALPRRTDLRAAALKHLMAPACQAHRLFDADADCFPAGIDAGGFRVEAITDYSDLAHHEGTPMPGLSELRCFAEAIRSPTSWTIDGTHTLAVRCM